MKKINHILSILLVSVFAATAILNMAACDGTGTTNANINLVGFPSTGSEDVNYGDVYELQKTIDDSDGITYLLSAEVKANNNKAVSIIAGCFGIEYSSGYTVTYTAELQGGATQKSVVTLNVVGEVPVLIQKPIFGIYQTGDSIDITQTADVLQGGEKIGSATVKSIVYTDTVGGSEHTVSNEAASYTPSNSGILSITYEYEGTVETTLQIPVGIKLTKGFVLPDGKDAAAGLVPLAGHDNILLDWVANPQITAEVPAANVIKWTLGSGRQDWRQIGLSARVRSHISSQSYSRAVVYMRVDATSTGTKWRPWIGGSGQGWWLTGANTTWFNVGEWCRLEIPAARFNADNIFQMSFDTDTAFITSGNFTAVYLAGFTLI